MMRVGPDPDCLDEGYSIVPGLLGVVAVALIIVLTIAIDRAVTPTPRAARPAMESEVMPCPQ